MTVKELMRVAPVTIILMGVMIGLFVIQVLTGMDIDSPSSQDLFKWGANFFPATFSNEPWRLISSAFLHIGLMHLMFNTFALYYFGQVAERLFGSIKFLALFLLSAIGGNLLNGLVTWYAISQSNVNQVGVSAGASGGIMGLGMALLTIEACRYVLHRRALSRYQTQAGENAPLPTSLKVNAAPLKGLALIMGINLAYGFVVPGIDNAGHIGGAVTGMILALALVWAMLSAQRQQTANHHPTNSPQTSPSMWQVWAAILMISVLYFGVWWWVADSWQAFV